MKSEQVPKKKRNIILLAIIAVLFVGGITVVVKTWPYNFIATAVYRLMGKTLPGKKTDELRNIRQFLSAKRKVDKKEYDSARDELNNLALKVDSKFLFFREIYFYLGYVYDATGDYSSEEALYTRLAKQDPTFSKFMWGLYHIRQRKTAEAQQELFESLKLDDQYKRLGKYRPTAVKALQDLTGQHAPLRDKQ